MSAELTGTGEPAVAPSELPPPKELVSLDVLIKVFTAAVVALVVSPLGAVASSLGAVVGALAGELVKRIVVARRWGKRRLAFLTPLVVLLQFVDSAIAKPLSRLAHALPTPSLGASGAHAAVGQAAATTAAAVTITFAGFAIPEAVLGHSLVSDRKSTFFSNTSAYPVALTVVEPGGDVQKVKALRGDEAVYTFEGQAEQHVLAAATALTMDGQLSPYLELRGGELDPAPSHDLDNDHDDFVEATLSDDSYSLVLLPNGDGDVTATVHLFLVPPDAHGSVEPSVSGDAAHVATTAPGQAAELAFVGRQGEHVLFRFENARVDPSSETILPTLFSKEAGPSQPEVSGEVFGADGGVLQATLGSSGEYVLRLDPSWLAVLRQLAVTAYEVSSNRSFPLRARTEVSTTVPGQAAEITFEGHAGERVFLRFTDVSISPNKPPGSVQPTIVQGEGSVLVSGSPFEVDGGELEAVLPAEDTYTLQLVPAGAAVLERAVVLAYRVANESEAALTLGAGVTSVETTVPGERVTVRFRTRRKAHATFTLTGFRITPADGSAALTLYPPGGESSGALASATLPGYTTLEADLEQAGTYTLVLDPASFAVGAVKISSSLQ